MQARTMRESDCGLRRKAERDKRLADALRDNLRRRKAQRRERAKAVQDDTADGREESRR
jgi:hypothetical protein